MSEDFSDDFIVEEESSNRTFLIAAGALVGIFVLILICALVFALSNRGNDQALIAEIESQNATTEAQNLLVTQTIVAMQTEAARPTNTPLPTVTPIPPTATATATPPATDTPVVQPVTEEAETATPVLAGTSIFGGTQFGNTPTPIPAAAGGGTLPETGIETWGIITAAIVFLALLVIARRLRTG